MCEWVLNSWKWFLIVFYWTNFLWNLFCNRTQKFFISNIKFWTSKYWYTFTTFVQETTFDENIYNYNFFIHSINSIYMKPQLFGYQIHAAVASGNLKQICFISLFRSSKIWKIMSVQRQKSLKKILNILVNFWNRIKKSLRFIFWSTRRFARMRHRQRLKWLSEANTKMNCFYTTK